MSHRYLYLRDYSKQNKHPVGCVAVEVDEAAKQVRYAFSACSPLDKFSSQVARDKASGRLTQSPVVLEGNVPDSHHDVMCKVMEHIVETNKLQGPNIKRSVTAYLSAQAWLDQAQKIKTQKEAA
jgi:hypothetical protein